MYKNINQTAEKHIPNKGYYHAFTPELNDYRSPKANCVICDQAFNKHQDHLYAY
jgi:hypothetical protein